MKRLLNYRQNLLKINKSSFMSGIYGAFLKSKKITEFYNKMSRGLLTDEKILEKGTIGRSVINKLTNDRLFGTKEGITICFEGVNLSDEIKSLNDFFNEYQKSSVEFIKNLKGSFSGFILDENIQKVFVFNDHLSSKNIFYYYDEKFGFVFCSELKAISKLFRKHEVPFSLNRDAVYMMSLYGFLLEDNTYIKEIKKLPYSSVIYFDYKTNTMSINKHFCYQSLKKEKIKSSDAIVELNALFEQSVIRCWNKDLKYGNRHLSLLSGGMDARTNVLVAKKLGFKNISTITFGQSNSQDIRYSQKIAVGENLNHFTRFLDYPSYLIDDIEKNYVRPNDGLMMYHTSAHMSSTLKSFNTQPYSILHTGQIGDVLLGSFSQEKFDFKKNKAIIGYTGNVGELELLKKIESLNSILEKYQELGYEIYSYEQRQINATLVGDRSLNNVIDNFSPFYDLDLINFCLSLPSDLKKNQIIYYDWLKKYHRNILNYPWEKIQLKPNSRFKIIYGKYYKKYFNGAKKYFHLNYDSMNPYAVWMKKHPFILETLNRILAEEIESPYIDSELKNDLRQIYNRDIFEYRNKFAVITALLALKLHFRD